jgi:hypothetical protein
MKTLKQLGIWMDHSVANIIELKDDTVVTNTLELSTSLPEQIENQELDESLMNNKEQNYLSDYFLNLSKVIKEYNEVLLFGPSSAQTELYNRLKDDLHFDKIKIDVKSADVMTDNQQQIFVKEFFGA